MRVLIVTNTYPPGDISGVGALAVELAHALDAQGHPTHVLTRRAPPDDRFAVPTGGPKLLFPLLAALRFATLVRRERFDLVHIHESDGALVAALLRAARALGVGWGRARLVATLQVSYVRERRAVRAVRAGGRVVSRPTTAERVFAWLRAPILAALGRLTARLADAVVAPSEATARELKEDYGAQVAAVIPNGVVEPAARTASARIEAGPVFLYAGRLRTRKAVAVLLEAFAQARRALPASASLVLAGDGEQRPALEAQARRLGIPDHVRFEGGLARDRMAAHYAAADVFCLPSTYEGFPVAILEAMSFGLPVVATRVAGIPEAVADGVTGLIVAAEDDAAFARALVRLGTDAALRQDMGEAGRRRFTALYRRDTVAAAHLELYAKLAGSAHGKLDASPTDSS